MSLILPIAAILLAYLLVWALCAAAGQADERLEREREQRHDDERSAA